MRNKLFILVTISVIIIFSDKLNLLNPIKNLAEKIIVMPASYATNKIYKGLENNFKILTFWKSGEERIKNLESRLWELEGLRGQVKALLLENDVLKKQQNIVLAKDRKKILANVLKPREEMVLDVGDNDAVKIGSVVFYQNIYIGQIYKVTPNRSFVRLPVDSDSRISVKVRATRGEAAGRFNNSLIVDKISQEEVVAEGDPILTLGEGEFSLANLVIGKLGKSKGADSDLFKTFDVIPAIDYSKLAQVFVLL